MNNEKTTLLIIDPQYDFHDVPDENKLTQGVDDDGNLIKVEPSLPVAGSWEDSIRLAAFIKSLKESLNEVVVTLDTHQRYDIAHPMYWRNKEGKSPVPLTLVEGGDISPITKEMIENGEWIPVDPSMKEHALSYVSHLSLCGKYSLMIWPPHCILGEPGHNIVKPVADSLALWEEFSGSSCTVSLKGTNPDTEHYGAFQAEYIIESDNSTVLNQDLINKINESDRIYIAGQALSHCVASTVRQLVSNVNSEDAKKIILLTDATSSVPGFEQAGQDFINEMISLGVKTSKVSEII